MEITLNISNRIYQDIQLFCNANNLDVNEYLIELINEKHALNKFGDLNEKLPKVIEESTVVAKKRGRPKKKSDSTTKTETTTAQALPINDEQIMQSDQHIMKENVNEKAIKQEEAVRKKPTVQRRRSLQTL